jgi:hypothetical protein
MTGQTPDVLSNDLLITRGSADRVVAQLKGTTTLFEESLTAVCSEDLLRKYPVKSRWTFSSTR